MGVSVRIRVMVKGRDRGKFRVRVRSGLGLVFKLGFSLKSYYNVGGLSDSTV